VKSLSIQEIRSLIGPSADHVSLRIELEEKLRPRIAERLASLPAEEQEYQHTGDWGDPQGRNWSLTQDRELGPVPALQLRNDPRHRAPPPALQDHDSGLELHGTELREVAQVASKHSPQKAYMTKVDGPLVSPLTVMPLRFEALTWGPCVLFWRCFVRSWPLTAVLRPRLRPSRLARSAVLAYRWSAALAVATCMASQRSWGHVATEAVVASDRGGELWGEVGDAFGLAMLVPIGIGSDLAGRLLAALLPAFPVPTGDSAGSVSGRMAWWRYALTKQYLMVVAALVFAGIAGVMAILLSSLAPQPRAAVAFAAFLVAVIADLLIFPLLRAFLDTIILTCASSLTIAKWPSLLFFGPQASELTDPDTLTSWTSRADLLRYSEALAAELSPLRHWTPKR